ncbi:MAG: flagellar basal body P-ring protein FlgI [Planctomycetaceae bacterium]|nr:flagellar basal body P-ring protein FlgI [Planctomycetaceae bacterium]
MNRTASRLLLMLAIALSADAAFARVRLEHICTVGGPKEVKLTGLGLVVGLKGTGDGGKNLPTMRALATALKLHNTPVLAPDELKDAKNVAIVLIEATVPATGLRRGQRLDCYVSSLMGAKSLRGGRLLVAPVETPDVGSELAVGLASGPIAVESADVPTTGKISGGIVLEEDFYAYFVDRRDGSPKVTLLLDQSHASFHSAGEVARVINAEFSFEAGGELAKAIGPGAIIVGVPSQYENDPVKFLALLMEVGVDNPSTQARVVVNTKSGTVVVTGEVEISPVVIAHKKLTVRVGDPLAEPEPDRFRILGAKNDPSRPQLDQLVEALNSMQVPTEDVIDILRELNRSGKLHAEFIEY